MSDRAELLAELQRLFPQLPAQCGGEPGLVDTSKWNDWVGQSTTPDQLQMEQFLTWQPLAGRRLLHVGVGNSGLAVRFRSSLGEIVGTTVTASELELANSLQLSNYRCHLHNKHHGACEAIEGPFDYILDNNLTTYACCLTHFADMLHEYDRLLGDGGAIVTDVLGLGHRLTDDPQLARFAFDSADLAAIAALFGLQAFPVVAGSVIVLARAQPAGPRLACKLRFLSNRLRDKLRR